MLADLFEFLFCPMHGLVSKLVWLPFFVEFLHYVRDHCMSVYFWIRNRILGGAL